MTESGTAPGARLGRMQYRAAGRRGSLVRPARRMPLSHSIHGGVIHITAAGGFSEADAIALFDAIGRDPALRPPMPVLVDARESVTVPDQTLLRRYAGLAMQRGPAIGGRWAFVVADDLRYGLGRVFEAFTAGSGIECRVFRDPAAARAWLRSASNESPA